MIFLVVIVLFGALSAIITALLGEKYGIRYADMIIIGILLTPILPLYICIQAALIDRKRKK